MQDKELRTHETLLEILIDMRSSHELILGSIGEGAYRVVHDGRTTLVNRATLSSTGFVEELLPNHQQEKDMNTDAPQELKGCTLLLADDEFINRRMFSSILEKQGAVVHCAEDGKEALELFQKEHFDCILMDVQMPNCNGFEAIQGIRELESQQQNGPTPAIALTAHALSGYKQQCHEAGMDEFISKPVDAGLLVHTIRNLVRQKKSH